MDVSALGGRRPEEYGRQEEVSYMSNHEGQAPSNQRGRRTTREDTVRRCYQCDSIDHVKRNCPELQKGGSVQGSRSQSRVGKSGVDKTPGCRRRGRNNHLIGTCRARTHLNGNPLPALTPGDWPGNIRNMERWENEELEADEEDERDYQESQGIQTMGMGFPQGRSGL